MCSCMSECVYALLCACVCVRVCTYGVCVCVCVCVCNCYLVNKYCMKSKIKSCIIEKIQLDMTFIDRQHFGADQLYITRLRGRVWSRLVQLWHCRLCTKQ